MYISKPNFVVIAQCTLRYNYLWFGKRNVRHIRILLPVSISNISYWVSHCASGCQILSKSDHPQWRYDVISIFKMVAAAAQFYFQFTGFGLGDIALLRRPVSVSKPNFVVIAESTSEF